MGRFECHLVAPGMCQSPKALVARDAKVTCTSYMATVASILYISPSALHANAAFAH